MLEVTSNIMLIVLGDVIQVLKLYKVKDVMILIPELKNLITNWLLKLALLLSEISPMYLRLHLTMAPPLQTLLPLLLILFLVQVTVHPMVAATQIQVFVHVVLVLI